ncbi:MAG: (5-formylfuran-3-yl)methyl phosphate synthase [Gammaproteobacteria bacterium]
MTGFLASVASLAEARVVFEGGADLIDLKSPADGVLGAVTPVVMREVLSYIRARRPVSATVGDLPSRPKTIAAAVQRVAAAGIDLIKVGLFDGGDRPAILKALGREASHGMRIVVVLFADREPRCREAIPALADAGLAGVMLDTADKRGGGLRSYVSDLDLGELVRVARGCGLMSGLAGSLGLHDIAPLHALAPDYLGFRSALCLSGQRCNEVNADAVRAVRSRIPADWAKLVSSDKRTAFGVRNRNDLEGDGNELASQKA